MSSSEISRAQARGLLDYFANRQTEFLKLTRAVVETESPSGYVEGVCAVVSLLADEARKISDVTSVERIENPRYGEHLRVRAFGYTNDAETEASRQILIVGHTDTVHERGS